jgi:hypothetical protein
VNFADFLNKVGIHGPGGVYGKFMKKLALHTENLLDSGFSDDQLPKVEKLVDTVSKAAEDIERAEKAINW